MSYLLDFVKSFDETELKQFRQLDLIGKEELLRDEYANHARQKNFNEANLVSKYILTQSHFDKINSVLLDKIVAKLFADDYNQTLFVILQKGLSALMFHELKVIEKRLSKNINPKQAIKFYRAAFENLRSMFHPNYNSKLTRNYGEKYLQALGKDKTAGDECYVSLMSLYGDIIESTYAATDNLQIPKAKQELEKWSQRAKGRKDPEAEFYVSFVFATYYKYFTEDAQAFLKANEQALNAYRKTTGRIDDKYEGIVLCELGFGNMCMNNFSAALKFYGEAIQKYADTIGKSFYHTGNYFGAAVCSKNYSLAQEIFDTHLKPKIQPTTNRSVLFDIYFMTAWFNIHQSKFDTAAAYLQLLQQYKKKETTIMGQAMLRQLESAYFYFSGDAATASLTIDKNLRFLLKLVRQSSYASYYLQYVDLLGKLIKFEQGKLRFPQKFFSQLDALPQGINQFYNIPLLEKVAQFR
jgi:hypothetical protein